MEKIRNVENLVPLLETVYYEDCPGCKIEKRKDTDDSVPWKTLISVGLIVISGALPISSLFPYLYFMIRDFNIAQQEADVGYYAGFVGCAFLVGRASTSVLWGIAADRYGRKPVIIFGLMTAIIFNTLFGLSVNFWMALSTRFLLGCLNGLNGPAKAYVSEVCSEKHQAIAMATITSAWSIALVVGPALGGLLAQPAEKYPNIISKDSLLGRFPYFLPCLVISVSSAFVVVGALWLPESLHNHKPKDTSAACDSYEAEESATCRPDDDTTATKPRASLLTNWPFMSSIVVYGIFALQDMAYSEIFSLWAVSPKKLGGLSYSTEEVGSVLAFTGLGMLVSQMFLFPYMHNMLGPILLARSCGVLIMPLLQSYPFIALSSGLTLRVLLNCACLMKLSIHTCILTSTFILQNRAVEQDQRGAANGIAMMAMSLFTAIGPACGGSLLSWTEKRGNTAFLPGTHMLFFILNVVQLIGVLCTFKPFLVERKQDSEDINQKITSS